MFYVTKTKESRGEKKNCPFFLLENSRPLSPWGLLDFLSTYLGIDSLTFKEYSGLISSRIDWVNRSIMFNSLRPHGLQHTGLPCPSPTSRACSNSCPSSWWCYPTNWFSVIHFSSCLQSFPASGSFPKSQFFTSGGQSIGASASASVLLKCCCWLTKKTLGFLASRREAFNPGPETRLDHAELLCNRVLLNYKRDRETSDIDIRKGQKECPLSQWIERISRGCKEIHWNNPHFKITGLTRRPSGRRNSPQVGYISAI